MFNGIWLIACEPVAVGRLLYAEGERFEVSRIHSGAMLVMGRAILAEQPGRPTPPEPIEVVPAPRRRGRPRKVVDPTAPVSDAPPKRQYRRRDLEAEP